MSIDRREMQEKFERVTWNKHPCGAGSLYENTKVIRDYLLGVVAKYNIQSIADAGAGDLSWISKVTWPHNVLYAAYDIKPRHKDVMQCDVTDTVLPPHDLILCRHVLNHLFRWPELRKKAMENFVASGSKYILCSYDPNEEYFDDVWGEKLEGTTDVPYKPGGRVWHYGLWRLNDD